MSFSTAKIGAIVWGLWGLLHAGVGVSALAPSLSGDASGALKALAGAAPPEAGAGLHPAVESLLANHAFNLLWAGLFAVVVAVLFNWRESRGGYWANLAVISGFNVGFLLFVVAPEHIPLAMGAIGPALWVLGAVLGGMGLQKMAIEKPIT